jgi:hypothetical protein
MSRFLSFSRVVPSSMPHLKIPKDLDLTPFDGLFVYSTSFHIGQMRAWWLGNFRKFRAL